MSLITGLVSAQCKHEGVILTMSCILRPPLYFPRVSLGWCKTKALHNGMSVVKEPFCPRRVLRVPCEQRRLSLGSRCATRGPSCLRSHRRGRRFPWSEGECEPGCPHALPPVCFGILCMGRARALRSGCAGFSLAAKGFPGRAPSGGSPWAGKAVLALNVPAALGRRRTRY